MVSVSVSVMVMVKVRDMVKVMVKVMVRVRVRVNVSVRVKGKGKGKVKVRVMEIKMKINAVEEQTIRNNLKDLCKFFAKEAVNDTLEALSEEKVKDNQGVYDCIHDMLIGVNLTEEVLNFLKEKLEVR